MGEKDADGGVMLGGEDMEGVIEEAPREETVAVVEEEVERKSTPYLPKPPKKSHRQRNIFLAIVGTLVAIVVLCGGVVLGTKVQKQEEAKNDGALSGEVSQDALLGGGGGVPLTDVKQMAGDDKLTLAFLKMHNTKENSCYSPLSIRYALEMLSEGAEGETKTQIDNLLGNIRATRYENVPGYLSIANSLWMRTAYEEKVLDSYKEALKEKYGAEILADSFESASRINSWIEEKTFGMLKDVLADESVKDETVMTALVNALAIDMNWEQEFQKESTFGGYFNVTDDTLEDDTYTMMTTGTRGTRETSLYYNFAKDATVFASDLKEYGGTKLQFVAILPAEGELTEYVEKVSNDDINRLLSGLRIAKAQNENYQFSFQVYIPKFEIEGGLENLIGDLESLGVTDAFNASVADFKKMIDQEGFAIQEAVHDTKFEFSEEGIKAAAVTVFVGGLGAGGGPSAIPSSVHIVVSINKPFMYLVRDVKTGEIWFAGMVYEPNRWADEKAMYGKE